ncbi:MAG: cytidylate kinase-like family protein [Clostridiales bacterium]|nr:cytidylate kinase-like family protein [Clostridiales bacterium]MCD7757444.1 cytidylate kinase-like family protein [Clostridiales bacterium]MCD7858329.1 cytidylate kinase-like family protein [Clostridiales bacterium]
MNRIITISREFGSGGRTVGKLTAEKLGIPCYDQELLEKIEEKSGFSKEYIQDRGEYTAHGSWFINAFAGRDTTGKSTQDYLWNHQRDVILELAEEGPCVIVGRCADYILRGSADCLRVFIHASMGKRAARIVQVYGQREESPEKRLKDKDQRRRAYYQYYTDTEWGVARNYHIALDSGELGIERCVELISSLY